MKFKDLDGRRKSALKRLEKYLSEWNSHDKDKTTRSGKIRSHEDEKIRLENEIQNIKNNLLKRTTNAL
jgi:hypothetical protein